MSEDPFKDLLARFEAMHQELREMRKEASDGREVREALESRRRADADRQARLRSEKRHVTSRDSNVTRRSVKALDLDPEKKQQELSTSASRENHVTSRDNAPTRDAFAAAYVARHKVDPVWNATTNSQLSRFVKRIGREEAPLVAEFYVSHNSSWYLQKLHPVGLMLSDAEKLRAEWKRGRQITPTEARQQERTQANGESWARHLREEKDAG